MTLLQMSGSAAFLILSITVLRAVLMHRIPKKTFIFLWMLVLFRLLIPVSIPSVFSIYSWMPQSNISHAPEPTNYLPSFFVSPDMSGENITKSLVTPEITGFSISLWTILWFAGFLSFAIYFRIVYHRGMSKFKNSLPVETAFIMDWKEKHPLKRTLSIRSSDQVFSPLSYGILKPVIVLPEKSDFDNANALDFILTHEYIHIKNFDILTKMIMILALCVHWFNPMVWVMFFLLNRDIELVCDETVVRLFGETYKSLYSHILIDMEIQKSGIMPLCNNFSKNAIEERIGAIMKMKKRTVFSFVFAAFLVMAITVVLAVSSVPSKEKDRIIDSGLSPEEYKQVLSLKFTGYEELSISEYQEKVWAITDTEEYQKLLERVSKDDALYEQKDSNAGASFLFNILEPLTAEKWQERQFGGYIQTNYSEASDNAILEYSYIITIINPLTLTVGEYDKTRLSIKNELNELIQNKTAKELQDEASMNTHIRSAIQSIKERYNNDKLQIDVNYAYQPLYRQKTDTVNKIPIGGESEKEYPNATRDDLESLLALRTLNYQAMSVSSFNKSLIEWANEDYDRSERVAADYTLKNNKIPLSEEEENFIGFTVRASGAENAELVRSLHTSEPIQDPVMRIDLPAKKGSSENETSAWYSAYYQLSYHIENKDALRIGERDFYLGNVLSEIQKFWENTELHMITETDKNEIEKVFGEIAMKNSNEKMTFSIVEGQFNLEYSNP